MIVEFIGTPGAGKTTLLPVAADFFRARGFDAYSVVDAARPIATRSPWGKAVTRLVPPSWQGPALWQVFYHLSKVWRIRFFLDHPKLIWMVLRFQRRRPISDLDRHHVLYWFFHHVGYYSFLKAHARPREVLLFDEGFIHRVVQLYASEAEEPDFSHMFAYINRLPRPDLVIRPVASEESCVQRVYSRGLWDRFRQKSPAEVSRYMANAQMIVHEAVEQIKTAGWTLVEVDNDGVTTSVAAAELRQKLSLLPQFATGNSTAEVFTRSVPSL